MSKLHTPAIAIAGFFVLGCGVAALAEEKEHTPKGKQGFENLDTNHDGFLSLEEVQAAHPGLTAEKFNTKDKDGDGKISKEEFGGNQKREKPSFDALDTSRDGFLSLEELQAAHPGMTEQKLEMHDKDGDGKISKDEYMHPGKTKEHEVKQ